MVPPEGSLPFMVLGPPDRIYSLRAQLHLHLVSWSYLLGLKARLSGRRPFVSLGLEEFLKRSWDLCCSLFGKFRDLNTLGAEQVLLKSHHADGI